jgi:hypothetical protein
MEEARTAQDLATKRLSRQAHSGGRQPGKVLVTFSDGTRAIFKPARDGQGLNEQESDQ